MITLFIIQSCADAKNPSITIKSFDGMIAESHCVASFVEINEHFKSNEWYAVIYDDEHIDEPLNEGLKVFIKHSNADALILLKLCDKRAYKCPRLFKRNVTLMGDKLLPQNKNIKFETVLNGWLLPNV